MSRFDRLKNWPEKLNAMTLGELRAERRYWEEQGQSLGHAQARKESAKRARHVEAVLKRRFPDAGDGT